MSSLSLTNYTCKSAIEQSAQSVKVPDWPVPVITDSPASFAEIIGALQEAQKLGDAKSKGYREGWAIASHLLGSDCANCSLRSDVGVAASTKPFEHARRVGQVLGRLVEHGLTSLAGDEADDPQQWQQAGFVTGLAEGWVAGTPQESGQVTKGEDEQKPTSAPAISQTSLASDMGTGTAHHFEHPCFDSSCQIPSVPRGQTFSSMSSEWRADAIQKAKTDLIDRITSNTECGLLSRPMEESRKEALDAFDRALERLGAPSTQEDRISPFSETAEDK